MIFDTDVLVWAERGNAKALQVVSQAGERAVSIMTYMELLQGVRGPKEREDLKAFISEGNFIVFPLTENIGHRALIYVEEHALSSGMRASDAIIAATAVENNYALVSGNLKHYKFLKELKFKHFRYS